MGGTDSQENSDSNQENSESIQESSDLNNILTEQERIDLLNSKALNIEFNSSGGF